MLFRFGVAGHRHNCPQSKGHDPWVVGTSRLHSQLALTAELATVGPIECGASRVSEPDASGIRKRGYRSYPSHGSWIVFSRSATVGSQAPSSHPARRLGRLRTLLDLARPSKRVGSATDYCLQPREDICSIGDSYGAVRRPQIEKARPCFFFSSLSKNHCIPAQVGSAAHVVPRMFSLQRPVW